MFELKLSLLAMNYSDEDLSDLVKEMPPMQFPSDWYIKLMPPFAGAPIRFSASLDNFTETAISIYFDAKDVLGCMGSPYWEIYPDIEGDCSRFLLKEIDEMFEAIGKSLQNQLSKTQNKNN